MLVHVRYWSPYIHYVQIVMPSKIRRPKLAKTLSVKNIPKPDNLLITVSFTTIKSQTNSLKLSENKSNPAWAQAHIYSYT